MGGAVDPTVLNIVVFVLAVFVIDKEGIIRHREVLEDARNEPDYQKVNDALARLG